MDWININVNLIRGEEYIDAEPVSRATWLSLTAWCGSQENGGIIADSRKWGDRKWQQLCGVTLSEVETTCLLYGFVGDNLVVNFYPVEQEAKVIKNRANGSKGGRPKKNPLPQPVEPQEEKPCGLPSGSDSLKRKEKERKEKERKEKEILEANAERVYQEYPRKVAKQPALKAIAKALKVTPADQLVEHLKLYSESVKNKDHNYLPHPATYFNEGRHLEPVEIITPPKPISKFTPQL